MRCSTVFAGLFMAASALALPLDASSSNTALKPVEAVKDLSARAPAPQIDIDLSDVLGDVSDVVDNLVVALEQVLDPVLLALQNVTTVLNELLVDPSVVDSTLTLANSLITIQGVQTSINGLTGATLTTDDVSDLTSVNSALQTLLDTVNNLISTGNTDTTLVSIQTLLNQIIATVNGLLDGITVTA
ncbi:hypothetical protein AYL99_02587 [Fonsecaea erecta]|uniref:Uncharacterized protein n=1 Tax=Fonsecaea erecta TaxID=1367422 RepID=A0A178ZUB8_9EURO|nr:hypothetical protein AYL99_02587 [Fonsecaea erecta]OAP63360.1 hypothetical protein AYL99_02587 [Fonsecaea erecta]